MAHLAGFAKLDGLDLGNTGVTDAGLKHLARLKGLTRLGLNNTAISDEGLNHLHVLKGLQHMWLKGIKGTEKGVRELQQALPGVEVSVGRVGRRAGPWWQGSGRCIIPMPDPHREKVRNSIRTSPWVSLRSLFSYRQGIGIGFVTISVPSISIERKQARGGSGNNRQWLTRSLGIASRSLASPLAVTRVPASVTSCSPFSFCKWTKLSSVTTVPASLILLREFSP